MNRLQKKCVMATTGFHLLLLVILFVGPAFFWSREKPDDTPVLDMIPANLVDTATTGVQSAQPPPPRTAARCAGRRRRTRARRCRHRSPRRPAFGRSCRPACTA